MRRWVGYLTALCFVFFLCIITGSIGYYVHREEIRPLYNYAERIIVKGRRELGLPTETVKEVERVRTIYLTLRGTTYLMPDNDFMGGGALAVWGDDVLVLHKSGRVLALDPDKGLIDIDFPVPANNFSEYVALAKKEYPNQIALERGIRYNDIEFIESPSFRGFLLSYTYIDVVNRCYFSRVSKLEVPVSVNSIYELSVSQSDWEILFDTSPCLAFNDSRELIVGYMAGGRLAFKKPNLVYFGSGEYHREGFYRPDAGIQSDDSDYGKTIEINVETGANRHFSKGHRNLQGVALDKLGRLWTTEHGMRGGDELNLIIDGENYGWPLENLGTLYSGVPAATSGRIGRHEEFTPPTYAWLPSAAVSSIALVDSFHDTWDGDLLIGSLKGKTLFRVRIRDERVVFLERIPIGQRIRDVMQINTSKIALWLDTNELVIFEVEELDDPLAGLVAGLIRKGVEPDLASNASIVLEGCQECHSFSENVHLAGPSLHGVVGRRVASTSFPGYSTGLLAMSGRWTTDSLAGYIEDPEAVAPGTLMSGMGLGNSELANAVANALEWIDSNGAVAPE